MVDKTLTKNCIVCGKEMQVFHLTSRMWLGRYAPLTGYFLRVIVVERETQMKRRFRRFLAGDMTYEWYTSSHLNKGEVDRLLAVLKSHARLGVITGLPIFDQRKYFLSTHKGELIYSLSEYFEGDEAFKERIHRRLVDVGTGNARTVTHLSGNHF